MLVALKLLVTVTRLVPKCKCPLVFSISDSCLSIIFDFLVSTTSAVYESRVTQQDS